jgi:hypothetical protein
VLVVQAAIERNFISINISMHRPLMIFLFPLVILCGWRVWFVCFCWESNPGPREAQTRARGKDLRSLRYRNLQPVKREDQKGIPPSTHFYIRIYLDKPFLHLQQLQENRDYRMESPFQHYSVKVKG